MIRRRHQLGLVVASQALRVAFRHACPAEFHFKNLDRRGAQGAYKLCMLSRHVLARNPAAFVRDRSQGDERVLLHQPVVHRRAVAGRPHVLQGGPHFPVHDQRAIARHADSRILQEACRRPDAYRHQHDIAGNVARPGLHRAGVSLFLNSRHRAPDHDPHAVPLQLLGYYVSCARGLDVDKPRNLAKSVTVE